MAGFEIKVPITLKGGKEGEKVGNVIGKSIANQIEKVYKSIGLGKSKEGGGEAGAIGGMSKGLKGLVLKLGALTAVAVGILSVLKKSSPYLRGIFSIFGRALSIFFRPFGDFLASMLRPLAVWLMKMAVSWLKFTRTGVGEKVVGAGTGAGAGALIGAGIGSIFPGIGTLFGAGAGALIGGLIGLLKTIDWKALGEQIKGFADWVWNNLTSIWDWMYDFGGWVWEKLISVWNYAMDFGGFLWEKVKTVWNYMMDFGGWLWMMLKTVWNYVMNFGSWLWEKLKTIWSWTWNFGSWVWSKVTSIWSWGHNFGDWLWSKVKSIWSWGGGNDDGYATGTPFVPSDGMYKLHRGEQVIPRGQTNNKSMVFRPTFQITSSGISQDIDMDAIVRRAGRMTEMELKKRGIL